MTIASFTAFLKKLSVNNSHSNSNISTILFKFVAKVSSLDSKSLSQTIYVLN